MPLKIVPFLILAFGIAAIGYGLWKRHIDPPRLISRGTYAFTDKNGTQLIFPKRVVAAAGFETTEVQLPGGTWIDCRGDCAERIRIEYTDIWDSQRLGQR